MTWLFKQLLFHLFKNLDEISYLYTIMADHTMQDVAFQNHGITRKFLRVHQTAIQLNTYSQIYTRNY